MVKREVDKETCSSQVSSFKAEIMQVSGECWERERETDFEVRVEG